ncbi:hypothetical protein KF840_19300 [bacterium]|nr:hypothetical protein [bacterium]
MNTTTDERDDHAYPQQCRTCGGKIDEGEGVLLEDDDDAAYYHHGCAN